MPTQERDTGRRLGAADWLALAAAPTFTAMAVLTAVFDGAQPSMCTSAPAATLPVAGMLPMYVLMGAFHMVPWLRLVSARCRRRQRPFPVRA